MNANGFGVESVTVPAAASASAVRPGGTNTPFSGDLFFGSVMNEMVAATSSAVSGLPSEQVTPLRRVKVTESGRTSHLSARAGTILPSASAAVSVS